MAGLIRVRALADRRRRAGLAFGPEWTELDGSQINEAQFLTILQDELLDLQLRRDADAEWESYPHRAQAIEVLSDHVAYDLEHGRAHDMLVAPAEEQTPFQSLEGAEDRTDDGAPASVASEAKAGAAEDQAPAADPVEGASPAAGEAQEAREGTDDAAAGQDGASDGEQQPAESSQPPVAVPDTSAQAEPETEHTPKPAGSHRRGKTAKAD